MKTWKTISILTALFLTAGLSVSGAGQDGSKTSDTNPAGSVKMRSEEKAVRSSDGKKEAAAVGEVPSSELSARAQKKKDKVRTEYVTGSFIKREVRKNGYITDAPMDLSIINRKAINQTGAVTVRGVLVRTGVGGR